jgi:3-oxoacyl-[acyl-carrier protein] reductase
MRLEGRTAIITGAGSGFGAAMATEFAKEGARVVVNDLNDNTGRSVVDDIRKAGGEAMFHKANVADGGEVKTMIEAVTDAYGGFNVLINNAGVPQWNQPLTETDEETFDRIFDVNVKSIYFTSIHGIPVMKKGGGGVIIHTASTAATRPRAGLAWYNASKGAVANLTLTMAQELAPDIRVNAICPVATDTPMLDDFLGGDRDKIAAFEATVPMGRLGQPMDVARSAVFLASDDASFLTGVLLPVDGGRCAA